MTTTKRAAEGDDPASSGRSFFEKLDLKQTIESTGMTLRRMVIAIAVLGVILAGSAYDIAILGDNWPFSSYNLYTRVRSEPELKRIVPYGLTTEGKEIDLLKRRYFRPLRQRLIWRPIVQAMKANDPAKLQQVIDELMEVYYQNGSGPELTSVRVYQCIWELKPKASNRDTPRKVLLHELDARKPE